MERNCNKCLWATRDGGCASWNCEFVDKSEAYEAWNRAMGGLLPEGDPQKNVGCKYTTTTERTEKVIHKSDTYVVIPPKSTTTCYETRTNLWEECGNCHAMGMYHGWNYCPMCGCRLEWE